MTVDHSLGNGVYYDTDDYAGVFRRIAVLFIDGIALMLFGAGLWLVLVVAFWTPENEITLSGVFFAMWAMSAWCYLTIIKSSKLRTIGYRLLGLKIVTTKGGRPSFLAMTCRMLLWVFGPFNLIVDLLWLGADSEQQSLRDCYVGTYVVRKSAQPIGEAPIHLTRYHGGGLAPAYPRVVRHSRRDHQTT